MHDIYLIVTVFVQALLDKNDQHQIWAKRIFPIVQKATKVYITEAVFIEIASALSVVNRNGASKFIRNCYVTSNINVIAVDHILFIRALELYESRLDKHWSLVDCMSFIVMSEFNIQHAISTDHHFEQARFQLIK